MDKFEILVFDSGIGGLNVLNKLKNANPNCSFYYTSDSKNTPYGEKSQSQLFKMSTKMLDRALSYKKFNAVVIACNTLSTTILQSLRNRYFGVDFYGIFPQVEVAKKGRTLLLCTSATSKSTYIMKAKSRYKNLDVRPLEHLAKEIEKKVFSLCKIDLKKHLDFSIDGYDFLLLGCTHYLYLEDKFRSLMPKTRILCGSIGMGDHFALGQLTTTDLFCKDRGLSGSAEFIFEDKIRNFKIYESVFQP